MVQFCKSVGLRSLVETLEGRRLFSVAFGTVAKFSLGENAPEQIATANLNGDKLPDAIVSNFDGGLSIMVNKGAGKFALASTIPDSNGVGSLAVGDFNGDGKPDVAYIDGALNVALGLGNGKFAAPVKYSYGVNLQNVVTADFNGDGKLDLAATDIIGDAVLIFKGNKNGAFAAPSTITGIPGASGIVAGDFTGDHKIDLAVTSFGHVIFNTDGSISAGPSDGVRLLPGNGKGSFTFGAKFKVHGAYPTEIAAGDINGDGKLDLVTTDGGLGGLIGTNTASVLMNYGGGHFAYPKVEVTGGSPQFVHLIDVNHDGHLDIVTADEIGNDISIFTYKSGPDYFNPALTIKVGSPVDVAVLDVNSDGKLDLLTDSNMDNTLDVLLGL